MKLQKLSEKTVLSYLAMRIQVSLPELVRHVGMPVSTVMGILSRLSRKGLVTKAGSLAGARGRPMAIYKLKLREPVAACHFDGTRLTAGILDLDFRIRAMERIDIGSVDSVQCAGDLLAEVLARLEKAAQIPRKSMSGLALSINAVQIGTRVLMSSVLPWANETAVPAFTAKLHLPVRLVHLPAVLAEYQKFSTQAPRSMVLFNVGDGVSAHMLIAGKLFRGGSHLAGELGHVIVDPAGPLCGCGRRGCLEAYCSGPAIYKHVLEELASGVVCSVDRRVLADLPPRRAAEELWQAWKSGDSYVRALVDQVCDRLGWGLALTINLMDPEYVAMGGYLLKDRSEWIEEVVRRAQRWILHAANRKTRYESSRVNDEDELRVIGSCYHYYEVGAVKPSAEAPPTVTGG